MDSYIKSGITKSAGSFFFWQKWLFYSSLFFALFGLVFAVFADSPLFLFYQRKLGDLFWGIGKIPDNVMPFYSFMAGPTGGTLACCYLLLAGIAWHPFKRKERWARNTIAIAFGVWFIIDSTVAVFYGAYFQLYIFNCGSLVQKALPLIFTWNEFKSDNKAIAISSR